MRKHITDPDYAERLLALPDDATPEQVKAASPSAQPQQEPIGEVVVGDEGVVKGWTVVKWRADLPPIAVGTKLYAAPVALPEQQAGITIDQAQQIARACMNLRLGEQLPDCLLALVRPPL